MDNGYISPSIFAENRERCGTKILSTGDLEQINDFAKRTLVPRKIWGVNKNCGNDTMW